MRQGFPQLCEKTFFTLTNQTTVDTLFPGYIRKPGSLANTIVVMPGTRKHSNRKTARAVVLGLLLPFDVPG